MIIRSGLIQNRPEVDPDRFRTHWRTVHGPLAKALPNLRGYVQNLLLDRRDLRPSGLHAVDGISQLWFDDVEAMEKGMSSPENDACVTDISGFLANVTLAVQQPGGWNGAADRASATKVMAVHVGGADRARLEAFLSSRLPTGSRCSWRINPVLGNDFIVDPSITRSEEKIVSVMEAWFADAAAARDLLSAALWTEAELRPAMIAAVEEFVVLAPPDT